jgi:hypothetical protein
MVNTTHIRFNVALMPMVSNVSEYSAINPAYTPAVFVPIIISETILLGNTSMPLYYLCLFRNRY